MARRQVPSAFLAHRCGRGADSVAAAPSAPLSRRSRSKENHEHPSRGPVRRRSLDLARRPPSSSSSSPEPCWSSRSPSAPSRGAIQI